MKLAKTQKHSRKKAKRRQTPEEKFQKEWQRVLNFQKTNANLRQQIEDFAVLVEQEIGDCETKLCQAFCNQNHRLANFIAKKTLPQYMREALLEWIEHNLNSIMSNPFSHNVNLEDLMDVLHQNLEQHEKNEFEKSEKRNPDLASEMEEVLEDEDIDSLVEDLFDELEDDFVDEFDTEFEDDFDEDLEDDLDWDVDAKQQHEMDKLLKSSSINKLFRRLAKALHPDLVQNEAEKEQRHHLMSELINARKNKDIVKIMAMYTEHVGEAPTDLFNNDFEKMTKLLKFRVDQLKAEKEEIIHENPRNGAIYYEFYDPSPKKVQRALQRRRETIELKMEVLDNTTSELTSLKKLKPLLRAMAEQFHMERHFRDPFLFDEDEELPF